MKGTTATADNALVRMAQAFGELLAFDFLTHFSH